MIKTKKILLPFFILVLLSAITVLISVALFIGGNEYDRYVSYTYDSTEKNAIDGIDWGPNTPQKNITRAQFVKILAYASKDELNQYEGFSPFADCINHHLNADINWAYQNGIVKGISATEFAPETYISREEMAMMIYRYANYKNLILPKIVSIVIFPIFLTIMVH